MKKYEILSSDLKPNTKLYRIIPYSRFVQLFENKRNCLVRPSLWEDPFENLALKSLQNLNGEIGKLEFADDIYGQCWTLHSASDAMWRIYGSNNTGIRIRSTVEKLAQALADSLNHTVTSAFIGKVSYLNDKGLRKFAATHFSEGYGPSQNKEAETLLIKRKAFIHEREVRLIYTSPDRTKPENNLYFYEIDPHQLIDQIMLHPQLPTNEARWLEKSIKVNTNWSGKIIQSMMYRPPEGFTFDVGGYSNNEPM